MPTPALISFGTTTAHKLTFCLHGGSVRIIGHLRKPLAVAPRRSDSYPSCNSPSRVLNAVDEMRLLAVTYPRFVDLIRGTGFIDCVELKRAQVPQATMLYPESKRY